MTFCTSGREALEHVHAQPFDVVVSDMRMPEMDGAELLAEIRRIHPDSIRIILSGESDSGAIFRSMGVTHRFLDKPCDPARLKETIELARVGPETLFADDSVASVLRYIDHLPMMPRLYGKLVERLRAGNAPAQEIGELIAQDVAMTAKVLQIVNSAAFSPRRPIERADRAVAYLGVERVKQLVLAAGVFEQFQGKIKPSWMDGIWHSSTRAAGLAERIARDADADKDVVDAVSSAAMLHLTGRLILCSNFSERWDAAVKRSEREGVPLSLAETEEFDVRQGPIGAHVLSLWGIPVRIVQAVAFHAKPMAASEGYQEVATLAHAACALAEDPTGAQIDLEPLRHAGLEGQVEIWRALAQEIGDEVEP